MGESTPMICTLTDFERSSRTTTWHDVLHTSVTKVEERGDGYVLALNDSRLGLQQIRDLVKMERECCQWMNLALREESPPSLSITSQSHGGKAAIKDMLGL